MTGIEFFLKKKIYGRNEHPKGWGEYVYNFENIHFYLLQILLEDCPEFAKRLVKSSSPPKEVKVTLQPDGGTFDLLAVIDGKSFYLEVKIWATLTESQFDRQVEHIKRKKAHGCYILFTWADEKWPSDKVLKRSGNCCHKIDEKDLVKALKAIDSFSRPEIAEIAVAYHSVLRDIRRRWQEEWASSIRAMASKSAPMP
jgi:hypothetical protein